MRIASVDGLVEHIHTFRVSFDIIYHHLISKNRRTRNEIQLQYRQIRLISRHAPRPTNPLQRDTATHNKTPYKKKSHLLNKTHIPTRLLSKRL